MIKNNNQTQVQHTVLDKLIDKREIVLFNDDVNSFDHVITTLMEYCNHTAIQAEQCAHLVHYKGKCAIKVGTMAELRPICSALLDKGLSAEII